MANERPPPSRESSIRTTSLSRQSSRRSTASQAAETYSLDDFPGVADGFRPSDNVDSSSANLVQSAAQDHQSAGSHPPGPGPLKNMRNRPSSISKPAHDSLTLQHEHPDSLSASSSSNDSSTVSSGSAATGAMQPSFPYLLYDQGIATHDQAMPAPNSLPQPQTMSPEGITGPSHPYGLYTQSTSAVGTTPSPSIPFGAGAGDPTALGQLGNVEVPPPYTRYPEVAYAPKEAALAAEVSPTTPSQSSPPTLPAVAGAGGLGVATRNPEFSSTEEDLAAPEAQSSVQRQSSHVSSHEANEAAHEGEKDSQPEWKREVRRRAKLRMCGIIPYWALCLTITVLVVLSAIMGALLGTLLQQDEKVEDQQSGSQTNADTKPPIGEIQPYDDPPSDLEDITTGLFGLPEMEINAAPKLCFNESSDAQAWSCNIPYRYYSIDITRIKNATNTANYDLELIPFNETDAQFIWGTQPPNVPKPVVLQLVNDTFDDGRGPAWWLKIQYNKTVIVREDVFQWDDKVDKTKAKRTWDYDTYNKLDFDPTRLRTSSKGAAEGDKPWICTWPNTTLEIFIYPNANASLQDPPSASVDADYDQPTPSYDPSSDPGPMSPYPKVVKFLERRLYGPDTKATCRQVAIVNGGTDTEDLTDDDGNKIEFEIEERNIEKDELNASTSKRELHERDVGFSLTTRGTAQELSPCGCYWLST